MGMGQKISAHKAKRILEMHLAGDTQSQIATALHLNQSTISLTIGKFKSLAAQYGLEAAAEEYGIMDQIASLHGLAVEVKAAGISVEEAAAGAKVVKLFQKYGVKPEHYGDLIHACTELKSDGSLPYAVKLAHLESATGKTSEQLVNHFEEISQQLPAQEKKLQVLKSKVSATEADLASLENKKKAASQDLEKHLKQVGLDMHRLELVEGLAISLMHGAVGDMDLAQYIDRQKQLNKAGISIGILTQILDAAKVLTYYDGGKELLQGLNQYKGFSGAIGTMKVQLQSFEKQAAGLEKNAQLKAEIEGQIVSLKAEVAGLQGLATQVVNKKEELGQLTAEVGKVAEKNIALEQGNAALQAHRSALIADVQATEQKVSNLKEVEKAYDELVAKCAQIEAKVAPLEMKLELFDSFLGVIQQTVSNENLDKISQTLPYLVAEVKKGKYSPNLLRDQVLKDLTGGTLCTLKCQCCGARFAGDKPPAAAGYKCPKCGAIGMTQVDQSEANILNAALAPKKKTVIIQTVTPINKPKPNDKQQP